MTLLKDLIHIPEHVQRGDFVLKLTEGVQRSQETLDNYVFTDQLRTAFGQGLELIKSSIERRESKAAFLHGSFGSGKSHYLAVLHLLLAHDPVARAHVELAPLVQKHSWLTGKKLMLVPFHMIGAESLEQAVFTQYLAYVNRVHPGHPSPAVFLGEPVLEQADALRAQMGDEKFFPALGAADGWGDLSGWDAESYARARKAEPNSPDRRRLISAIVDKLLPSYSRVIVGSGEGFVPIDEGLAILCEHAKSLGYDALLFFLDEVVLWLASRVADTQFVNRESMKLVKLVEAQNARALPIISLLARQRDLRELVGENSPGAEKLSALDALKYFEGRFSTIKLEDRNLPVIVQKRILKPKSDSAEREIDLKFAETKKLRQEIQDVLRTSSYTEEDFRRVYPFSPALIQSLVAVSSVLQRERTAIRVLLQLLVDRRESLSLGSIVPVGDLYDAIAEGDEPFSDGMRAIFDGAKKLYREKLRPRLCQDQGVTWEVMEGLPPTDPKREGFRRDDRIVKTLLLAVLAPEVEALKGLTSQKLVALNHGTYRSTIPGQEVGMVLGKLRRWQPDVSEIHLDGDVNNPTVQLRILGVDTSSILEKAANEDNPGNRRVMVRKILFERLGIAWQDTFETVHSFWWRGTRRQISVVFSNIRELPSASLRSQGNDWKLVIDFPFDGPDREPQEDLQRLEDFRSSEGSTRTACWLPAFLSSARQNDLGRLVVLEYALASDNRFHELASHLPPVERGQAKAQLAAQKEALRARISLSLEAAYGIGKEESDMLGPKLEVSERFQCLDSSTTRLNRPAVGTLDKALESLCDQMLRLQYPKHPAFEGEIKTGTLKRVYEWVQRAASMDPQRVVVEKERRTEVRGVVDPLGLGTLPEDALVLSTNWVEHFEREMARKKSDSLTVGDLRAWTDKPEARGLPTEVQNLLIMAFADMQRRRFLLHGGPVVPSIDKLQDDIELRPQPLPDKAQFAAARERAAKAFGVSVGEVVGPANVSQLIEAIKDQVTKGLSSARELESQLRQRLSAMEIPFDSSTRACTAQAVVSVLEALSKADPNHLIERLATARAPSSWEAFGTSLKQAEAVAKALRDTRWESMEPAFRLSGAFVEQSAAIKHEVVELLKVDELTASLPSKLRVLESRCAELVKKALAGEPKPPTPVPPPKGGAGPAKIVSLEEGARSAIGAAALQQLSAELAEKVSKGKRTITISWRIDEEQP